MGIRPNPLAPKIAVPLSPAQTIETRSPDVVKSEIAARLRTITAADFRGLTPEDIDRAMRQQSAIDAITAQYADQVSRTGIALGAAQRRALERAEDKADKRNELIFKSKEGAAKSVADSNLTADQQAAWFDRITKTERLEDALALAIEANALPKRITSGVERDAVASELYSGRNYSQLDSAQQANVNAQLTDRYFVVVNNQGVWIVDKRTRTMKRAAAAKGEDVGETPAAPVEPRATQTTPRVTTGQEALVEQLRTLDPDAAQRYYNEVQTYTESPVQKQRNYDALIKAQPTLKDKVKPPNTPQRGSSLTSPGETIMSDIESPYGEPVLAGERYAQAATVPVAIEKAGVPARSISPALFVMENVRQNENVNTFRDRVKGLGRERAIEVYTNALEQLPDVNVQSQYREALVRTWPDLSKILRDPTMLVGRVTPQQAPGAPAPPKLTADQEKSYNWGTRAVNANNIINDLESRGEYGTGSILSRAERISKLTPEQASRLARTGGAIVGLVVGGVLGALSRRAGAPITLPSKIGSVGGVGEPIQIPGNRLARALVGGGAGAIGGGFAGDPFGAGVTIMSEEVANWVRDEQDRSYLQAKIDFISANLRKESGAVINLDEFLREEARYFPALRDTAANIAQKARARDIAIKALEVESGAKFPQLK
jgi:hypothetical protein